MVFKVLILAASIAFANASPYPAARAIAKAVVPAEFDAYPQYYFTYTVPDSLTGDNKEQTVNRNGDVYTVESDGTRRSIDYTVDPINAAPVAYYAAPAVAKFAAPIAYYAAPVAKVASPMPYLYAFPPTNAYLG